MRFRQAPAKPRKPLPTGIQTKLAQAVLRAARRAAESDRCSAAEMLFEMGSNDLSAASARARSSGAIVKALDAGMDGAETAKAVMDCRERERTAQALPKGTP